MKLPRDKDGMSDLLAELGWSWVAETTETPRGQQHTVRPDGVIRLGDGRTMGWDEDTDDDGDGPQGWVLDGHCIDTVDDLRRMLASGTGEEAAR